jgi:hypothetical protein
VKVGDLVQYKHPQVRDSFDTGFGLVIKIDNEREYDGLGHFEGDKYLIQWSIGRRWFVAQEWVEVVQ